MFYLKYILSSLLFIGVFFGCVPKEVVVKETISTEKKIVLEDSHIEIKTPVVKAGYELDSTDGEIYDLKNIPQDVDYYTKSISDKTKLYNIQKKYEKQYFSVWNIKKHPDSLNASRWAFALHKTTNSYGENLQPLNQKFFDKTYENANFVEYSTLNLKAITIKEVNVRAFPTIQPLFRDPSLAGEGYPFDYLQNSTIHANKPIFISHYSKDKEWVFVFSSFTSGWIKSNELVILSKKYTDIWQKAQQISITQEGIPIYSTTGRFLFKSKIGMMFALIDENKNEYTVLSVSSYKHNKPLFLKSKISKNISTNKILKFTKENLNMIVREVSKTNYGWGGLYGQRDCSSMLRDLYAPFGIWLPRNSSRQAKIGKVIKLDNKLSLEEKEKKILSDAVPFETLFYKKGHVMLYVGKHNGRAIIFHNVWGIKTIKDSIEGRLIVGRPVFSTLELGSHQPNYDKDAKLLEKIKSINILTK